jgi:hypothetical protein
MEIGQKVVFVRHVNGAEVGKHGTVMRVADDAVLVGLQVARTSSSSDGPDVGPLARATMETYLKTFQHEGNVGHR